MMKFTLAIVLLSVSSLASGAVLTCLVDDSAAPASWPKEYLKVQTYQASADSFRVSTIDYIHQLPNDDGTFSEKAEALYGAGIRAGLKVQACASSDRNEVQQSGDIVIHSDCRSTDAAQITTQILFSSHLSTQTDGSLSIYLWQPGQDQIQRKISTAACK